MEDELLWEQSRGNPERARVPGAREGGSDGGRSSTRFVHPHPSIMHSGGCSASKLVAAMIAAPFWGRATFIPGFAAPRGVSVFQIYQTTTNQPALSAGAGAR